MNKHLRLFAVLAAGMLAADAFAAGLLAPAAHDQVPAALSARNAGAGTSTLEHTPVQYSHAIDATQALDATPKPHVAQSREFWSDVSETELRAGVKFNTTTPGALIRLSPQGGASAALDPAAVMIRGNGHRLRVDEASAAIADTAALRAAGMDVSAGTLAFRLAHSAGSGEMELVAPHAHGRYVVHVFEPESPVALSLSADRDTVLAGTPITFQVSLDGGAMRIASGLVTAPDGYSADLHFARSVDGAFRATFTPDAAHSVGPQLWEAHAFTASNAGALSVLRDARTAFAVSAPSARLTGDAQVANDASGVSVRFGVVAASASRYQLDGVLYGTGADGARRPIALAQSAAWLEAGRGFVELRFNADAIASGGLHAPFEVRNLRLVDQATMGVIERRERALIVD